MVPMGSQLVAGTRQTKAGTAMAACCVVNLLVVTVHLAMLQYNSLQQPTTPFMEPMALTVVQMLVKNIYLLLLFKVRS